MTRKGQRNTSPRREQKRRAGTKTKRRIAIVTGTRAEYGLLCSTMKALAKYPHVQLQIVVTGSHLLRRFGQTIDQIRSDGWTIDVTVPMQKGDDGPLDQAQGLARGVRGIAAFLDQAMSDVVVVLGDRIEAMAGALAAVTTGRVLAHIHGGDLAAGDVDDSLRHAITKLAHLHLPATRESARRIIRMGEPSWRVKVVGAPGLDDIVRWNSKIRGPHGKRNSTSRQALVVHHPCGRSAETERRAMSAVLEAVRQEELHALCLYPCTDRGHCGILDAIRKRSEHCLNGEFRVAPSLPRPEFLQAMKESCVMVGNSSSGIIEAASLGTPAVNVGPRQTGRQPSGPSVIHCGESVAEIRAAIRKAVRLRPIRHRNAYGDGRAGRRIAAILTSIPLNARLRAKLNSY